MTLQDLIKQAGATDPIDLLEFDNVENELTDIKCIEGPGVYEILGYRSDVHPEDEEILYIGKTKADHTHVGNRLYNQLKYQSKENFQKNVKTAGYKYCHRQDSYALLKDEKKAVFVTKVKVHQFGSNSGGCVGRDIAEILLINCYDEHPFFNIEFSDDMKVKMAAEEERDYLANHPSVISEEEQLEEGIYEIEIDKGEEDE